MANSSRAILSVLGCQPTPASSCHADRRKQWCGSQARVVTATDTQDDRLPQACPHSCTGTEEMLRDLVTRATAVGCGRVSCGGHGCCSETSNAPKNKELKSADNLPLDPAP